MIWFVAFVTCAVGGLWLLPARRRPDLTFESGATAIDSRPFG